MEKLYNLYRERHMMTKQDIISDVDGMVKVILEKAAKDPKHSYAYYKTMESLTDKFKQEIMDSVLMEKLEDGWRYEWDISYEGVSLYLVHAVLFDEYEFDTSMREDDQKYLLIQVDSKLMTVDEFARLYNTEVGTVRQWIRRGKIRTAKKLGSEWRIPELTDMPQRGYVSASYHWQEPLIDLPDKLRYLDEYGSATFMQDDDDKKLYHIYLYSKDEENNHFVKKHIECGSAERERVELALISNPVVTYCQNFRENLAIDLMTIYSNREEEE